MVEWWQFWESLFSPKTCDDLIKISKNLQMVDAVTGFGDKVSSNPNLRRSTVRWVRRRDRWIPIWDRILELINEANQNAFGFNLTIMREMQFTEYSADIKAHYDWHVDLDWCHKQPYHRKLSCVVQLSAPDSYQGGDLQMEHHAPDVKRLRQQGSVLVFPSFLKHRVTPVTEGIRHSLVAWYEGPKFR